MSKPVSSWEYARQKRLDQRVTAIVDSLPEPLPIEIEPPSAPVMIQMPNGTLMSPEDCLRYFERERQQMAHWNACWRRYMTRRNEKQVEATKTRAYELCGSAELNIIGMIANERTER